MQGLSWGDGKWCRPEGLRIRTVKINIIQEKIGFSALNKLYHIEPNKCKFNKYL
jgi:hypothetical protein